LNINMVVIYKEIRPGRYAKGKNYKTLYDLLNWVFEKTRPEHYFYEQGHQFQRAELSLLQQMRGRIVQLNLQRHNFQVTPHMVHERLMQWRTSQGLPQLTPQQIQDRYRAVGSDMRIEFEHNIARRIEQVKNNTIHL